MVTAGSVISNQYCSWKLGSDKIWDKQPDPRITVCNSYGPTSCGANNLYMIQQPHYPFPGQCAVGLRSNQLFVLWHDFKILFTKINVCKKLDGVNPVSNFPKMIVCLIQDCIPICTDGWTETTGWLRPTLSLILRLEPSGFVDTGKCHSTIESVSEGLARNTTTGSGTHHSYTKSAVLTFPIGINGVWGQGDQDGTLNLNIPPSKRWHCGTFSRMTSVCRSQCPVFISKLVMSLTYKTSALLGFLGFPGFMAIPFSFWFFCSCQSLEENVSLYHSDCRSVFKNLSNLNELWRE